MKNMLLSVLALSFSPMAYANYESQPFEVIRSGEGNDARTQGVLFQMGEIKVLRSQNAKNSDFRKLWVVHLPFDIDEDYLEKFGKVLHFEKSAFAIIESSPRAIMALSGAFHKKGMACGAFLKLTGDTIREKMFATPVPEIPVDKKHPRVSAAVAKVNKDRIRGTIETLAAMDNRFSNSALGKKVASILEAQYKEIAQGRADVSTEIYDHGSATPQPSLIVRIKGQTKPNEVIVLGSHIDSINFMGGKAPGADDNASGTATNQEVFRILMEEGIKLERTLEIHGYAAEELGLIGSQNMARRYAAAKVNVVAMLQNDMNLYKEQGAPTKIWFIKNNTDEQFNTMLGKLGEVYMGLPWEIRTLSGGDSDHTSWRRQGYATAFPFENPSKHNGKIHTSSDTIANSGAFEQAAAFAGLSLSYALHFGGIANNRN